MGATSRGFPYPSFSDQAAPPDHFYSLAANLNAYFDSYDTFVNNAVSSEAAARDRRDTELINDYRAADTAINNRISGLIQGGTWNPTFGGSNAAIGNNASTEGHWVVVGDEILYTGRIIFGSNASFGDGSPVVANVPVAVYQPTATGTGVLMTAGSATGYAIAIHFIAVDNNSYVIRRVKSDGSLGLGGDVGNVPQSSVLSFDLRGRRA